MTRKSMLVLGLAVLIAVAITYVPVAYAAGGHGRGTSPAQVNRGDQVAVMVARGAHFQNGLTTNAARGNLVDASCGCFVGRQLNTGNQTAIMDLTHAHFGGGVASNEATGNSMVFGSN